MRRAQQRQDGIRQATDRDDHVGEAPVAARIVSGDTVEPWQKRSHDADRQRGLDHERPRDQPAAGKAFA